ncbi:cupin domain-containing protein [Streptomyces sp. NPDC002680]|uniref:(R)-mandelonitrile lyase n=1 Tax=Streptomyces sp. NPDC002680 TaxID=3364659 RepID=UPI0036B82E49
MRLLEKTPSAKAPPERFTGDVWVDAITEAQEPSRLRAALVRFSPRARTAWHRHTLGQTLHVTEGIGLVQSRGGDVLVMRPGDTVHTPPGEWHWHGAAPDHFMTHLALSESTGDPAVPDVEWSEHVSEAEYEYEGNSSSEA